MRDKTSNYFECVVRYTKTTEGGDYKTATETYVEEAACFGDAEKRITEDTSAYITGDFLVKNINPAPYKEIFFSDTDTDDKFFRAKVSLITIDERTMKEKKTKLVYLVQAKDIGTARKYVCDVMSGTMSDYEINSISETPVLEVFEH